MKLQLSLAALLHNGQDVIFEETSLIKAGEEMKQNEKNMGDISSELVQYVLKSCLALGHLLRCAGNSD